MNTMDMNVFPVEIMKDYRRNVLIGRNHPITFETLLQDDSKVNLFDTNRRRFSDETIKCVFDLKSENIASVSVGPVIKSVLSLAGKVPDRLPSRSTVDKFTPIQAGVTQLQLSEVTPGQTSTTLYSDETRKFGKTYNTFLISDNEKRSYLFGLREIANKSSKTTLDTFKEILADISDAVNEREENGDVLSPAYLVLTNIQNLMSDRAATNLAFKDLLEKYRTDIFREILGVWDHLSTVEQAATSKVNSFFCGLHLLVNFADCVAEVLQKFESGILEKAKQFGDEAQTINLLRMCSKCFARGVDEKNGCYGQFSVWMQSQGNFKVRFPQFRGNKFNIVFVVAEIAFYHRKKIIEFFTNVNPASNRLQKELLQALQNSVFVTGIKVLGLFSKMVTAPLWRLIEENKHVLDMNSHYFVLLQYFERMSKDPSGFLSGEDHHGCEYLKRDDVFDSLGQTDDDDDTFLLAVSADSVTLAKTIFTAFHALLKKAMKEQLPGGTYFDDVDLFRNSTASVIPHNKLPEFVFGVLDYLMCHRPNATALANEAFLMYSHNKTHDWLEAKSPEEVNRLMETARKMAPEIKRKFQDRCRAVKEQRLAAMIKNLEEATRAEKRRLHEKEQLTSDIIYYELWQTTTTVDAKLQELGTDANKRRALECQIKFRKQVLGQTYHDANIFNITKKVGNSYQKLSVEALKQNLSCLISGALDVSGSQDESSTEAVPLLIGKRVEHTFDEGTWKGTVLGVVPGYNMCYNIIYDEDVSEEGETRTEPVVYTYKLKEDYIQGNLRILVVSEQCNIFLDGSLQYSSTAVFQFLMERRYFVFFLL